MANVGRRIIIPQGLLDPDQINVITIPPNLSKNTPLLVTPARSEGGPLRTRLLPDFRDELATANQDDNLPGHMEAVRRGCLSDPERSRSTSRDKNVLFNTTLPSQVGDISRISNTTPPSGMDFYVDDSRISDASPSPGFSQLGDSSGISNTTQPPGLYSSGMGYYDDSSRFSNISSPQLGDCSRISNTTPPPASGMGYYDDNSSPPGMSYTCDGYSMSTRDNTPVRMNTTPPFGLPQLDGTTSTLRTPPPAGFSNAPSPPSINATQNVSRELSPPSNLGNITQAIPGGNATFSRRCSSGVASDELGILHVSSRSVTQIGEGPIHNTTTTIDAPDVIDVNSCHRILTDQVHSLRGDTREPVKSQTNNFTLSSLYDSSAEMGADNNTDLFGRVMAGDFNTVKQMTISPERPFGKFPQRRGDCGFRPPYISTPMDENMKMHMTGSTNPSTVYSRGLFTKLGEYSGDETAPSSVYGGTYPPAVKPAPFQGRSLNQAKRQRSMSAPESDYSNKSGSCAGTFAGSPNATYNPSNNITFGHRGDGTFACPANAPTNATFGYPGDGTFVQSTGPGGNQGNATYPQARESQRCPGQSLHSQIEAFPAANQVAPTPPERTPPTYYPSGESSVYEDTSSNFWPSPTGNTVAGGGFRPMYCSTACPNSNAFMDDVSTMPDSIRQQRPPTPGRSATYPPMRQPLRMENQSLRSPSPDPVGIRPAAAFGSGRNLQGNNVSFSIQSEHNDGSEQYQDYSHISSCQEALCDEECALNSYDRRAQEYSHISSCMEALCMEDCSQEPRQDLYDTSRSGSSPQPVVRRGGSFYGSESSQDMHTSAGGGFPAPTGLKRGDYYSSGQNLYDGSPPGLKRGNFFGSGQNLYRSETSICDCSS